MSLTPSFLDELRARTVLSALIGKTIKVTRAGREFKACCPFHNEKTPSFTINDDKGFFHCFGCGAHGDAIRWMTEQRGLPFMEAVKELADAAGIAVPAPDPRAALRAEKAHNLRDVTEAAAAWYRERLADNGGTEARTYLDKRGFTSATVEAFGIGFAPDARSRMRDVLKPFGDAMAIEAGMLIQPPSDAPKDRREPYDRFRGRLMIPIRDVRGRVIGFGGRTIGAGEPKYLNSPDTPLFDKGRTLFNLDRAAAAARAAKRLIVVEGYMDVIALAQAGIDEAVAPLGTALTEAQIELVWRHAQAPILVFDGDNAGQRASRKAADRALNLLKPGCELKIARLPDGLDPDEYLNAHGPSEFRKELSNSLPLSEFLYCDEKINHETTHPEGRAALKGKLQDICSAVEHPIIRSEFKGWFIDRFFDDFGWRKKNEHKVHQSVDRSLFSVNERVARSIFRSLFYALSQYPQYIKIAYEQLALAKIDDDALLHWREALLDQIDVRPSTEEDCIEQIASENGIADLKKSDLGGDLIFPWSRNKKRLVDVLPSAISLVFEDLDLEGEIVRIKHRMKLDRNLDEYDELHAQRMLVVSRQRDVREAMMDLVVPPEVEHANVA